MYKQSIKQKVITEVRGEIPYINIGIRFNDYFTEDTYALISESDGKNSKKIPFSFYKNVEKIGEFVMENWNVDALLSNVFATVEDADFNKFFDEKEKSKIIKEVSDLHNFYDRIILLNEVNLEGEMNRMKQVAGITQKHIL